MSLQDKIDDYKQRKEAKAYFNQNNDAKIFPKDIVLALIIGIGATIVLGIILNVFTNMIHMRITLLFILVGYLQALAIKRCLDKSGMVLGVVAVVSFIIGMILAETIFIFFTVPGLSTSVLDIIRTVFNGMISGNIINSLSYVLAAFTAYSVVNN